MLRKLLLLSLLAAVCCLAQTTGSATLVGVVTDPTGAVIAGAKVTVVNTGTQFVSSTMTKADGGYYVPYLLPGTYRLTVEAAGFKSYVHGGIELRIDESPRINVQMEVGQLSDTVSVVASAPLLETETSAAGQV